MTSPLRTTMTRLVLITALGVSGLGIAAGSSRPMARPSAVPAARGTDVAPIIPVSTGTMIAANEAQLAANQAVIIKLLHQQITIDHKELISLGAIQSATAVLVKRENSGVPAPRAAALNLAGCRYGKSMFPKGAEVEFAPTRTEICTDAIAGKPTYGLAWHLMPAPQAK